MHAFVLGMKKLSWNAWLCGRNNETRLECMVLCWEYRNLAKMHCYVLEITRLGWNAWFCAGNEETRLECIGLC